MRTDFRWVIERAAAGIAVVIQGRLEYCSIPLQEILGYSAEELMGLQEQELFALIHPDDRPEVMRRAAQRCECDHQDVVERFELKVVSKSGDIHWLDCHARVRVCQGDSCAVVTCIDTTKNREVTEALAQSEQRLQLFMDHFRGIVFQGRMDFVPLFFRGAVEEITGYTEAELVSGAPSWDQLILAEDLPRISASIEDLASIPDHTATRQYRIRHRDGTIKWLHELIQSICDESGKPDFVQGTILEITENKNLELEREKLQAQLVQAQKMEAIGTLAGGMAHEMNNILAGIVGLASLLEDELGDHASQVDDVRRILHTAKRGSSLTSKLLGFARRGHGIRENVSLNASVTQVRGMLCRTVSSNIAAEDHLAAVPDTVTCDINQLEQVILNLCLNSVDAMPAGGTLRISTLTAVVTDGDDLDQPQLAPGRYVLLRVADDGMGMQEEVQRRACEPFFTRAPRIFIRDIYTDIPSSE